MTVEQPKQPIPESHTPGWRHLSAPEQQAYTQASVHARAAAALALHNLGEALATQTENLPSQLATRSLPELNRVVGAAHYLLGLLAPEQGRIETGQHVNPPVLPAHHQKDAVPTVSAAARIDTSTPATVPPADQVKQGPAAVPTEPASGSPEVQPAPEGSTAEQRRDIAPSVHMSFIGMVFGKKRAAQLQSEGLTQSQSQLIVDRLTRLYGTVAGRDPGEALERLHRWLAGKSDAELAADYGISANAVYLQRYSVARRLRERCTNDMLTLVLSDLDMLVEPPSDAQASSNQPAADSTASERYELTPQEKLHALAESLVSRLGGDEAIAKRFIYFLTPKYTHLRNDKTTEDLVVLMRGLYQESASVVAFTPLEQRALELMLAINTPQGQKPLIARYVMQRMRHNVPDTQSVVDLFLRVLNKFDAYVATAPRDNQ